MEGTGTGPAPATAEGTMEPTGNAPPPATPPATQQGQDTTRATRPAPRAPQKFELVAFRPPGYAVGEELPAIVTRANDMTPNLHVLADADCSTPPNALVKSAWYDAGHPNGGWSWPRVY